MPLSVSSRITPSRSTPKGYPTRRKPFVRFCIPWYYVFLIVASTYAVTALILYERITLSYSSTERQTPLQRLRSVAEEIVKEVEQSAFRTPTGRTSNHADELLQSRIQVMERIVRHLSGQNVRSCRYRDGHLYSTDLTCQVTGPVVYYNPHQEERHVCSEKIGPNATLLRNEPCLQAPTLFPVIPDLSGKGLPAITTRFQHALEAREFKDCDLPCLSAGDPSINTVRTIDGTPWNIIFSMEGSRYYQNLEISTYGYKSDQFWSTTSYQSEVPLPYFSWAEYNIVGPAVDYRKTIKAAVFLARNCHSDNNREKIVSDLEGSSFRIDSLSSCLHNAPPPPGVNIEDKQNVMQSYLFYLAFENQNVDDYITEKFWGPLVAGTVPVYYGAPNIRDHAPNHSAIFVQDFNSTQALAEYLDRVANDKKLYESYHEWRTRPLPPHFHARYDFTHVHSTCRTCRWAYARLYGLGWNHANQSLRELVLPRKVCLDASGLMQRPVREEWATARGDLLLQHGNGEAASCELGDSNRILTLGNGIFRRIIWEHDGIVDLVIEALVANSPSSFLRLQTPFAGLNGVRVINGHWRFQDNQSRVTILTQPTSGFDVRANDGTLSIALETASLPLRIRIIVEDIDTLHEGASKEENYFGRRMMEDFYNPIEGFVQVSGVL